MDKSTNPGEVHCWPRGIPFALRVVMYLEGVFRGRAKAHGAFTAEPPWRVTSWLRTRAERSGRFGPIPSAGLHGKTAREIYPS